ncbi:hypothetical protein DFH09DRAFT_138829 [Mycena vulgaris]|nr:hypothetical protein DFH09DRAFT_138829 [Mycena vulgaris]
MDVALHVARIRWLGERAWGAGTGGVECSRRRGISAGEWCRKSARSVCAVRELEPGSPSRGPSMSSSARPLPGQGGERTVARGWDQTNASRWRGVAYRNPACIASLLRLLLDRAAHPSPTRGVAARASAAPTARSSRRSCIASPPSPSRPSVVRLHVSSPPPHPTWIWCPPLPLLPPAARAPPGLLLPPPSDPSSPFPPTLRLAPHILILRRGSAAHDSRAQCPRSARKNTHTTCKSCCSRRRNRVPRPALPPAVLVLLLRGPVLLLLHLAAAHQRRPLPCIHADRARRTAATPAPARGPRAMILRRNEVYTERRMKYAGLDNGLVWGTDAARAGQGPGECGVCLRRRERDGERAVGHSRTERGAGGGTAGMTSRRA